MTPVSKTPNSNQSHTLFYCPMHPDITSDHEGRCPKCQMFLVNAKTDVKEDTDHHTHSSSSQHSQTPKTKNLIHNSAMDLLHTYTCPMHPDIRQNFEGNCPLCGMPLEPMMADKPPKALFDLKIKFGVSILVAILYYLSMHGFFIIPSFFSQTIWNWIGLVISFFLYLWAGSMFFILGINSLKSKSLNMYTLISIGLIVAFTYSAVVTIDPYLIHSIFWNGNGADTYYDGAMFILAFVTLGEILQLQASYQTGSAIKEILKLIPKEAYKIIQKDDQITEQVIESLAIQEGDILRVKPGNSVPVDGIVQQGNSTIDTSSITGESLPVLIKEQSTVIGGTLNKEGSFTMKATKTVKASSLYTIVQETAQATRTLSPIQKIADKVVVWFVPIVLLIALITLCIWILNGNSVFGIVSAISVIIIACPCALGMASPMSVMVGIGKAAQKGIIISNASVISTAKTIDTLVVDKTGTLTEGHPTLTHIYSIDPHTFSEQDILQYTASLEALSESPLSRVITETAYKQKLPLLSIHNFQYELGAGIMGTIITDTILIKSNQHHKDIIWYAGNKKLMDNHHISIPKHLTEKSVLFASEGNTIVYIAKNTKMIGLIAMMDPIKDSAKTSIAHLKKLGINVIMATGDRLETARHVGKILGIQKIYATMHPKDKAELINHLKKQGHTVAMAGDGVNDVLALSNASIGIAMGNGTDVAKQSGNVILVKGSLDGIIRLFSICTSIVKNIKQNLFLSFVYNSLAIIIATGVFYNIFGWILNPAVAGLAMSLSSFSVIMNALRLRYSKVQI